MAAAAPRRFRRSAHALEAEPAPSPASSRPSSPSAPPTPALLPLAPSAPNARRTVRRARASTSAPPAPPTSALSRSRPVPALNKGLDHYVVSKSVALEPRDSVEKYRIRWKGCGAEDDTWEHEENLDGSLSLLNSFRASKGPPPSTIAEKVGCAPTAQSFYRESWTDLMKIVNMIRSNKSRYCQKDIIIDKLPLDSKGCANLGQSDGLYMHSMDFNWP